ncbi:MAG: lasso peptide biosynthesis B2 protein [Acidimicrobiales bacterium]
MTRLLVRTIGFRRSTKLLGASSQRWPTSFRLRASAQEVATAVESSVAGRFGPTCLDRSLYLWFVLRANGIDSRIRIGVVPTPEAIEGHAWVEHAGSVLNDVETVADSYLVFDDDPTDVVFR